MTNVFLAPRSNETAYEHFESTIKGGRPYPFVEPYLDEAEKEILSHYPTVSIWGNLESLRSRWERMEPGDYILFYEKGRFYFSARVVMRKFSEELALKLWPPAKTGKPWSCLFFVDNIKDIDVPISAIREFADYDEGWDRVQGFMPLRESGVQAIIDKFGDIETFINQDSKVFHVIKNVLEEKDNEIITSEKPVQIDKEQLLKEASAYVQTQEAYKLSFSPKKVRIDNKRQKERVAELENYSCQLCGWQCEWTNSQGKKSYRIDIDHIIEKSDGGTEELNNLWALCPNCHAKKTIGVIKIDLKRKKAYENETPIELDHDSHLHW